MRLSVRYCRGSVTYSCGEEKRGRAFGQREWMALEFACMLGQGRCNEEDVDCVCAFESRLTHCGECGVRTAWGRSASIVVQ